MAETWLLNKSITPSTMSVNISFVSNGNTFSSIDMVGGMPSRYSILYDTTLVFEGLGGWINQAYRTVNFSTAPTGDLLAWLQANGTKQSSKLSVDLTTLSGWANLSAGNHTIKIKAKGTGYKESELSAGVTVSKVAPNPNVGSVLSDNVGTNEEFIATNDLTTYSNADQQTLTFINDYQTKELPELLTGLGFDLIQETTARDEEGTEYTETIDLNYWIKLTSTFSIFVVRNKITGVQRLDDNVSAYVISPDVVDKDLNKVKLIQVQPNHITALNTVKRSSSDPQDTLTPKTMKSGLSFLITRGNFDKILEAGTYKFVDGTLSSPQYEITQNFSFSSNNEECDQMSIYSGEVVSIEYSFVNSGAMAVYEGGSWEFVSLSCQTITLSTDQQVSPEFYNWAITQGNLVKQVSEYHTLTISDAYTYDLKIDVNGNDVTSPYTLQNGDIINVPTVTGSIVINGTSYATGYEGSLNINGEDIAITRTGPERTIDPDIRPATYITIHYTQS